MPTSGSMKEKEFGFIITQEISRTMTKKNLADKMTNFLTERKRDLMKELKLPENKIHTGCYYDCDTREYKGLLRIKKLCTDNRIDHLYNENKAIWTSTDCEPYTISIYKNY